MPFAYRRSPHQKFLSVAWSCLYERQIITQHLHNPSIKNHIITNTQVFTLVLSKSKHLLPQKLIGDTNMKQTGKLFSIYTYIYINSPFIQAVAVQFHRKKDRSHHELSQTRVSMHFMRFQIFPYRHCSLCS